MLSLGLKMNAIQTTFNLKSTGKSQWPRSLHRTRGIIACSSADEGGGAKRNGNGNGRGNNDDDDGDGSTNSFLSRRQTYSLLKQQLSVGARFENYKEAARIRDSLKSLEEEEPVLRLLRLLKKGVEEERFQDASNYRDELMILAPYFHLKSSSDSTTLGIRVQVRSMYIEGRSQPLRDQHVFAYGIRITNNSDRPVQLLRRHWIVTDACGKTENYWGNGVIGEQPVIYPRTGFEYSSACPLHTSSGRMEGDFEMKHIDMLGLAAFNVAIAPFSLTILEVEDGDDDITM